MGASKTLLTICSFIGVGLLLTFGVLSEKALAQDDSKEYMGAFMDQANQVIDSELNRMDTNPFEGDYQDSGGFDIRFKPPDNKWLDEDEKQWPPEEDSSSQPFAKPMTHPLTFQDSVSGFGDTMKSQDYADMAADLLNSPNTVQFINWHLTEPGIAAGLSAAMTQANLQLSNRYSAQQAMFEQFKLFPEWGDNLGKAYFNCVAKAMQEGGSTSGASSDSGEEADSWIRAQAQCLADRYTPMNGESGESSMFKGDKHFTLEHDPNVDKSSEKGSSGESGKKVYLSDYIFGTKQDSGASDTSSSGPDGNPETFKNAFKQYIGDAEISFGEASDKSSSGTTRGVASVIYKKIPPAYLPQVVYQHLVGNTYGAFTKTLKKACEAKMESATGSTDGAEATRDNPSKGQFIRYTLVNECKDNATAEQCAEDSSGDNVCCLLKRLSVPGFAMKALVLDYLLNEIYIRLDRSDHTADASSVCEKYFEKLKLDQLQTNPDKVNQVARKMFFVSKKVAIARMVASYLKAEEAVMKTTGGSFPTPIRNLALNLLYENAGTNSLQQAYSNNLDELRRALVVWPQVEVKKSRPVSLGETMKKAGAKPGMSSGSNSK